MEELSDKVVTQMTAEAKQHLEAFKVQFLEQASRVLSDINANYLPFIETDAWTNYRNYLKECVEQEYMSNLLNVRHADYQWAKNIRARIYNDNKEELQQGVIKDLEAEIASLKEQLSQRRWY